MLDGKEIQIIEMLIDKKINDKAQNKIIMKYLIQGNSLDGLTAWREFGCYRLGARISELRKSGVNIQDRWIDCEDKFGKKVKFKEYYISSTERERLDKIEQENEEKPIRKKGEIEMTIEKPLTQNIRDKANACVKLFRATNGYLTKEEIGEYIGVKNERSVRDIISLVKTKLPIISNSTTKGYKLAKTREDLQEVVHTWLEIDSRIEELKKGREPLIKFYGQFEKK